MQIKKIQNKIDCNANFGAKLEIAGYTKDISSKQLKIWEKIVKSIGCETDILELKFGNPIDIDVREQFPKPVDPNYLEKWKMQVWQLFGIYPHSEKLYISKRSIDSSFVRANMDEKYSENIGYWSNYYSKVEDKNILKEWHLNLTKASVNEYLKKLKKNINFVK